MELYRISVPKDDAWRVIEKIGEQNFAHFVDLNKNEKVFNLPYASQIKMCDEAERRLQYLIQKSHDMKVPCTRPQTLNSQNFQVNKMAEARSKAREILFESISEDINEKEKFVQQQTKMIGEMQANINKQVDMCHVLSFVAIQSNALGELQGGVLG